MRLFILRRFLLSLPFTPSSPFLPKESFPLKSSGRRTSAFPIPERLALSFNLLPRGETECDVLFPVALDPLAIAFHKPQVSVPEPPSAKIVATQERDDSFARDGRVVVRNTREQVVRDMFRGNVVEKVSANEGEVTVDCCSGATEKRPGVRSIFRN